jgi:Type I phosphodiesterase / nucleotide pyrophosphatase
MSIQRSRYNGSHGEPIIKTPMTNPSFHPYTHLAETTLLARQSLPPALGTETVCPSYDGLGLANVPALAMHWLSPDKTSATTALPSFNPALLGNTSVTEAWDSWQQQDEINHVVLLIMDAFGYDQLHTVMAEGDAPGLAEAIGSPQAFFMPATSVFPSTTATALTSAATAHAPAQHGIMGTRAYVREVGSVVNFLRWIPGVSPNSTPYTDSQLNPDTFIPVPNLYVTLEQAGVDVGIVSWRNFQGTSVSRFTTGGARAGKEGYIGYLTPIDGFVQLRDRLLKLPEKSKSFTQLYIPNLDSAAHRYGPLSPSYRAEVAALDFAMKRELFEPLRGRSDIVLLLVADHGQRTIEPEKVLWLNDHPDLTKLLSAPATGESQARFLHVRQGQEEAAIAYIKTHLADRFLAISKDKAIHLGLFGLPEQTPTEEMSDRMGDLILIPQNGWSCFQHVGETKPEDLQTTIVGIHGGVTRSEMLIPFLAYRF